MPATDNFRERQIEQSRETRETEFAARYLVRRGPAASTASILIVAATTAAAGADAGGRVQ